MAASRLTRRAVQHYHATIRDAPTVAVPTHTHFAAVSSVHKDETGTTEEAEWFECSVGNSIEANQAPQTADDEAVAWHIRHLCKSVYTCRLLALISSLIVNLKCMWQR